VPLSLNYLANLEKKNQNEVHGNILSSLPLDQSFALKYVEATITFLKKRFFGSPFI